MLGLLVSNYWYEWRDWRSTNAEYFLPGNEGRESVGLLVLVEWGMGIGGERGLKRRRGRIRNRNGRAWPETNEEEADWPSIGFGGAEARVPTVDTAIRIFTNTTDTANGNRVAARRRTPLELESGITETDYGLRITD